MQQDPAARKRFLREAKSAAALDHPYICHIHEVVEVEGKSFISMEYVQGETLMEKLTQGSLPLNDALEKATEIAEAVEEAHNQGIVHRDLKPSNIMLTPQGHVKVMDFGLAKQVTPVEGQEQEITTALTQPGSRLGTVPYMSPEQVRGQEVDTRSDIFSFGVVLYEMLSGVNPQKRGSAMDTANAILSETAPPLSRYVDDISVLLQHTVKKMLAKDPDQRYQLIHEVRTDLGEVIEEAADSIREAATGPSGASSVAGAAQPARWKRAILWGLNSLVLIVITGIAVWNLRPPPPRPVTRLAMALPPTERLARLDADLVIALSPDGTHLAHVVSQGGSVQLYLRSMDQLETRAIPGTERGVNPFFSPEGQWVGFFADGKLKKVSISGGSPLTLCDAPNPRGASWGPNNTIVFAPTSSSALWQVSADGGTPQPLTTLDSQRDERSHRWPQILPGSTAVLFTAARSGGTMDEGQIVAQSLETSERRLLIQGGTFPHYLPTGHLIYARAGTLLAVLFDLARLEVTGDPVPIVEEVRQSARGAAQFSFSSLGSLVYLSGGLGDAQRTLVWVDRQGAAQPLMAPLRPYLQPHLSPDGRQLAVEIEGTKRDIWVYEIPRETLTRLTFEGIQSQTPAWTPDGQRVTFSSARGRSFNLFWRPADGSGTEERLMTSEELPISLSWSPDGRLLGFCQLHPTTLWDIWLLPLEGERQPHPFLQTPFNETAPTFSPDGRWLAYVSDESGRFEIYVQPFPGPGRKLQISIEGGTEPLWAPNGRELFYRSENGQRMMAVDITTEPAFNAGKPRLLFEGRYDTRRTIGYGANYDVTANGQRFVMIRGEEGQGQINVVLNWFEELKRLVPTE